MKNRVLMKLALSVLLIGLVVCVSLPVGAEERGKQQYLKSIEVLPAGASYLLEINSFTRLTAGALTTGFFKMSMDPEVSEIVRWTKVFLEKELSRSHFSNAKFFDEIVPQAYQLFNKDAVFASYFSRKNGNYPICVLNTGVSKEESIEGTKKLFGYMKLGTLKVVSNNNHEFYLISSELGYFYFKGNIVVCKESTFKEMTGSDPCRSMAQNALYEEISSMRGNWLISIYSEFAQTRAGEQNSTLFPGGAHYILSEMRIEDKKFSEYVTVKLKEGQGARFHYFGSTKPMPRNEQVPKDATAFYQGNFNWQNSIHAVSSFFATLSRYSEKDIMEAIEEISLNLEEPLLDELCKCMSEDVSVVARLPKGAIYPYVAMTIPLKNEKRAVELADLINNLYPEDFLKRERRGVVYYWLRTRTFSPFTFGMTFDNGSLLVSNGVMGIKNELNDRENRENVSASDMIAGLSWTKVSNSQNFCFINLKRLVEIYLPLLKFLKDIDGNDLDYPTFADIEPYIEGLIVKENIEGDLIKLEAKGEVPFLLLSQLGFTEFLYRSFLASCFRTQSPFRMLKQNLAPTEGVLCADRMKMIFELAVEFADKHENAFPEKLDEITTGNNLELFRCPGVLSKIDPEDVQGTSDYFYFPKVIKGEKCILLCDHMKHLSGARNVLLADGTVLRYVNDEKLITLIDEYNKLKGASVHYMNGIIWER